MTDLRPLDCFPWWEIKTRQLPLAGRAYVVAVLPYRRGKVVRITDSDLGRAIKEAVAEAGGNFP